MKKRLMSLLLVSLMVLGILPLYGITAFAEDIIISVAEITNVTVPVAGETASFEYDIPADANYDKRFSDSHASCWVITEDNPTSIESLNNGVVSVEEFVFEEGYYYTICLWLQAKEGYSFDNNSTATVNGNEAMFILGEEANTILPTAFYTFYIEPENAIKYVDVIGVTAPVAGETASFDFIIPEGSLYSKWDDSTGCSNWAVTETMPESYDEILDADWMYDPTYGPDDDGTETSLVFEAGKYYTFIAWIQADTENVFSLDIMGTINGIDANVDIYYEQNQGCVYYTLYCPTYGDVNCDGKVGALDASLILQYDAMLIDARAINLSAADVSGDGSVGALDASLILQYDAMLIDSFPAQN